MFSLIKKGKINYSQYPHLSENAKSFLQQVNIKKQFKFDLKF